VCRQERLHYATDVHSSCLHRLPTEYIMSCMSDLDQTATYNCAPMAELVSQHSQP